MSSIQYPLQRASLYVVKQSEQPRNSCIIQTSSRSSLNAGNSTRLCQLFTISTTHAVPTLGHPPHVICIPLSGSGRIRYLHCQESYPTALVSCPHTDVNIKIHIVLQSGWDFSSVHSHSSILKLSHTITHTSTRASRGDNHMVGQPLCDIMHIDVTRKASSRDHPSSSAATS